ncbi:18023_t:CDS:1, partial [Funneliformis geosporum]
MDEDAQLAEALRLSLITTNEDEQLQAALLFSVQQPTNSQPIKNNQSENLQQALAIERSKNELLSQQLEALQKETIPTEVEIKHAQLEAENRVLREQLFQTKISAKQKNLER